MIRSCITVSLVEEARGGPFVFWHDLPAACRAARELGFDAIEIFPTSASDLDAAEVTRLLDEHQLQLAAVGTGAGWVKRQLHLCLPDEAQRTAARNFIRSIIDFAGEFGAATIIGSMQGRSGGEVDRPTALNYLGEALQELGEHAQQYGGMLLYEPLNRYETNLINTLAGGVALLQTLSAPNVRLLADLFHMNIEEVDLAAAFQAAGSAVGHVHWADTNRRAAGLGHQAFEPIAAALRAIDYQGCISAEVLPLPDSHTAARCTIESYRKHFGNG